MPLQFVSHQLCDRLSIENIAKGPPPVVHERTIGITRAAVAQNRLVTVPEKPAPQPMPAIMPSGIGVLQPPHSRHQVCLQTFPPSDDNVARSAPMRAPSSVAAHTPRPGMIKEKPFGFFADNALPSIPRAFRRITRRPTRSEPPAPPFTLICCSLSIFRPTPMPYSGSCQTNALSVKLRGSHAA